ncbi:MAG: hypothetical protein ACR2OB_01605 [Solirubrobacteraceae bacterium]
MAIYDTMQIHQARCADDLRQDSNVDGVTAPRRAARPESAPCSQTPASSSTNHRAALRAWRLTSKSTP